MQCTRCSHELCARKVPVFAGLSGEELERLSSRIGGETRRKGQSVFLQGDEAHRLLIVRTGKVKLVRFSAEGEERVLDILLPGDFYGEQHLFSPETYPFDAVALEDTALCVLEASVLRDMIRENGEMGLKIIEYLGRRLRMTRDMIGMLSEGSALRRLAAFLLYRQDILGGEMVLLSREDIGNSVNLRKETVSRKLHELEDMGYVSLEGHRKIRITNQKGLESLKY